MKVNLDSPADEAQIQIIPLIDVIFCILTFFILAALQLTRQQGIGLNLPKADTSSVLMRDTLLIGIDPTGQTFIENQGQKLLISNTQLAQLVQQYRQQQPESLIALQADQSVFYGKVMETLNIMRDVGGERVALITDPNTQPKENSTQPQVNPSNPSSTIQTSPLPNSIPGSGLPSDTLPTSPGLSPTTPGTSVQPTSPSVTQPTVPSDLTQPTVPNSASPAPTQQVPQ